MSLNGKSERQFSMNFGTSLVPDGGVLFRLWAPDARQVDLCLHVDSAVRKMVPMARQQGGWFVVQYHTAQVGDVYQFMIDRNLLVPDPVSRCQATDIHGPSVICDPHGYSWHDAGWRGRPWEETVLYELHVGTFSEAGTFKGVMERLDYLVQLGITAIQLMPIAEFPGNYNWGYDGALLFAPCSRYGKPEDLKALIDAAHARGLMVLLDVVYNHFGPEGNYLYVYARDAFFTDQFHTPWGMAINFSGSKSRTVRDFFIANALYWLEEYHMDGLRFDAVHAIFDQLSPDILEEIAEKVHLGPGSRRQVHLVLENDHNCVGYLNRKSDGQPEYFTAQWNDDVHHACHVLLTGETEGYYRDYCDGPIQHLGRCLTEGFAYQGDVSVYRDGAHRGEPSAHLPPSAFVSFLQNHDQIGNRALGERLITLCDQSDLHILVALILLAPSPPLLFMGEEFGAQTPFYYFCNFAPDLAESVTAGRRKEFEKFSQFRSPESRQYIPDPNAEETFLMSKLDWRAVEHNEKNSYLSFYRQLLSLRQQEIIPHLKNLQHHRAGFHLYADKSLQAWWMLANNDILTVILNLHEYGISVVPDISDLVPHDQIGVLPDRNSRLIYRYAGEGHHAWSSDCIPAKSIVWHYLELSDMVRRIE